MTQGVALSHLAFIGICNPDVLNIRIINPIIALQMLIINAAGLQSRPNARGIGIAIGFRFARRPLVPDERQMNARRLSHALESAFIPRHG